MAVKKICSSSYGNLGSLCDAQNGITAITGMILMTDSFQFDSYTDFADKTVWETAIKNKQIFPLMGALEYDDNTEETVYYDSPLGVKIKLRNGKYAYQFRFNLSLTQHQELQKFSSANLRYALVDSDGSIFCYSDDDTTVKGFSISTFEAEKMVRASADQPAWSPVTIIEKNSTEWNGFGIQITPDWVAEDLQGLANVNLALISQVENDPYFATFSILAPTGKLNSDGSKQTVPITGVPQADISLTLAPGSTNAIVGLTDNGDGTYVLETSTYSPDDLINLVEPSAMTSTGLLIESAGGFVVE